MHEAQQAELTDSMKMFRLGVEGGKPAPGTIGVAPEWFYKGCGTILRAHGEPLVVPPFGEDGGEEAEIAGIYFVDADGQPRRIGMAIGNEFSDHKFEKENYLNLAGSKIRNCSLGPELVIDPEFQSVAGRVTIIARARESHLVQGNCHRRKRDKATACANIEHHHFKFETHRRPGDVTCMHLPLARARLSFWRWRGAGRRRRDGNLLRRLWPRAAKPVEDFARRTQIICRPISSLNFYE